MVENSRAILMRFLRVCLLSALGLWAVALPLWSHDVLPESIKIFVVLDFSGPDHVGKDIASAIRKQLGQMESVVVVEDESLSKAKTNYPSLFERKVTPQMIKDLGRVLRADAVMVGNVYRYEAGQHLIDNGADEGEMPYLQRDIDLVFGYQIYETVNGALLWDKEYTLHDQRSLDAGEELSFDFLVEQAAEKVHADLSEHQTDQKVRLRTEPQPLSSNSLEWANQGLMVRTCRLYAGDLGPVQEQYRFHPGEVFWANVELDNLRQTTKGEVWLQGHLLVVDDKQQIVADEPLVVDRHMFRALSRAERSAHLSFRVVLPLFCKTGSYRLKLLFLDRVFNEAVSVNKAFTILTSV